MRFLRRGLAGVFLLSLTLGFLAYAGHTIYSAAQSRMAQESRPVPARERVFTARVITYTEGTISPVLTTFGEVRSRRSLELRAPAAGRIVELAEGFEDGGSVREGQLLVRIDPVEARTALDVARSELARAEAELDDALRALTLTADDLEAAEEQRDLRARALERRISLAERGVGSDAAVEEAELALSSARQAVVSRRQAEAQAEGRLGQARSALDRQRITVAEAERRLADTELFATFTGSLSDVAATAGGVVTVNERLARLVDPDALEVSFRLSTTQYARLLDSDGALLAAPVEVSLDVMGAAIVASGRLERVSADVGEGQTGRLIFARLDLPRGFRPGDFVTVRVSEPEMEDVAILPATAVDAAQTVLVIGEGDRLELAGVELLRRQGDEVVVRAPHLVGAEVVAERSPMLGAGIRVNPIREREERGSAGLAAGFARSDVPDADVDAPSDADTVELTDERRAALIAFVEGNTRMPAEARARMLSQLSQERVSVQIVEQLESRMGG